MLLAGLGSVRIGKNCDLGLDNAAKGHRPRSYLFPIGTSQPANNIHVFKHYGQNQRIISIYYRTEKFLRDKTGTFPRK